MDVNSYVKRLNHNGPEAYDIVEAVTKLCRKAPSLFLPEDIVSKLEFREYLQCEMNESASILVAGLRTQGHLTAPELITTTDELLQKLTVEGLPGSSRFLSIRRMNSWSRMRITLEMFLNICASFSLHPHYFELVAGMGHKLNPEDEYFISSFSKLRVGPNGAITSELHYNLQFFERHGRALENPWVCRQTAVCHVYDFKPQTSVWVIVQAPQAWERGLSNLHYHTSSHPLALHLRFVRAAHLNLREYLNYLGSTLLELDQTFSFPQPLVEFDVDFTAGQNVLSLRRYLFKATTILLGTKKTIDNISRHARVIQDLALVTQQRHAEFMDEVASISSSLENHTSTLQELLNISDDLKFAINSVLNFRNQEVLKTNSTQLQGIAEGEAHETRLMSEIARKTYDDSRTTLIATVIALVYLPASLVLSFFSTIFTEINTVSTSEMPQSAVSAHLIVHRQSWIAVLVIFVLIILTLGIFGAWRSQSSTFKMYYKQILQALAGLF